MTTLPLTTLDRMRNFILSFSSTMNGPHCFNKRKLAARALTWKGFELTVSFESELNGFIANLKAIQKSRLVCSWLQTTFKTFCKSTTELRRQWPRKRHEVADNSPCFPAQFQEEVALVHISSLLSNHSLCSSLRSRFSKRRGWHPTFIEQKLKRLLNCHQICYETVYVWLSETTKVESLPKLVAWKDDRGNNN